MENTKFIEQSITVDNNRIQTFYRLFAMATCLMGATISGCGENTGVDGGDDIARSGLQEELRKQLIAQGGALGLNTFLIPDSDDFSAIPQDPNNPLTQRKVVLGQLLFHDTAFALNGLSPDETGSWSCATCHHAAAGFKSGVSQGIGEGGIGFGDRGSERTLALGFDANATDGTETFPDLQPLTSPTILNSAFQDVMLWNGQFGNSASGSVNTGLPASFLITPDTPKVENERQLSGLETQAIAGINVHRLKMSPDTALQNNSIYRDMWEDAFGSDSTDIREDAGKSIAAFERTVLANKAPFQQWLRGNNTALSNNEVKGGLLFFGKAGCVDCHRGPALSSERGAMQDELFFAVGFDDFDEADDRIHLADESAPQLGRAELTNRGEDRFKFKIPQLYNLADTNVFGHGASFSSIEEVLAYKNTGVVQNQASIENLDSRFIPLTLDEKELMHLAKFLTQSLYDPDLRRYQPVSVPSGSRVVVDPFDLCTVVDEVCAREKR